MNTMFRLVYSILTAVKNRFLFYYRYFFLFILPNISGILRGKIIYKRIAMVQQLTICRGEGLVEIGVNCSFGYKLGGFNRGGAVELQARYKNAKIIIANNVATNNNVMLLAANYIEIGEDTLIGQYVTIMDHEAHGIDPLKRRKIGKIGKVIIGKNTWIGNNVVILKNSEIGDNTIVATGAVVSGKFPSNVIIGGVPAKIIGTV